MIRDRGSKNGACDLGLSVTQQSIFCCIQISKAVNFNWGLLAAALGSVHVSNKAVTGGIAAVMDEAALYAEVGALC